jgi:phosphate/sulfate permease
VVTSLHCAVAVGAIVGFTLVAKGFDGVEWWQIGKICISWVTSPVLGSRLLLPLPFPVLVAGCSKEGVWGS